MRRFGCLFHRLFQQGLPFQMHYRVLIFVARWRHNFREIAVKTVKSTEKFVRTTSYTWLTDYKHITLKCFRARNVDVHLYIFSARRYIALAAIVKICIGSPKMARNEQVCVNQKSLRR